MCLSNFIRSLLVPIRVSSFPAASELKLGAEIEGGLCLPIRFFAQERCVVEDDAAGKIGRRCPGEAPRGRNSTRLVWLHADLCWSTTSHSQENFNGALSRGLVPNEHKVAAC